MPDYIFSNDPWYRVYVGQIRDQAGNCRRCWIFFDPEVPIVYHQLEGGFPAEVQFVDLVIMEASIPQRSINCGHEIVQNAGVASTEVWSELKKSGELFLEQQKWMQDEIEKVVAAAAAKIGKYATFHTASMSASSLPKLYQAFNFREKLGCPKQEEQDEDSEDTSSEDGCVVSLHHPNHKWYHQWEQQLFDFETPYSEDHMLAMRTASILQCRFGTDSSPPVDLIYNMKCFGGAYARGDPRKVFEFHEWTEWLTNDRKARKNKRRKIKKGSVGAGSFS